MTSQDQSLYTATEWRQTKRFDRRRGGYAFPYAFITRSAGLPLLAPTSHSQKFKSNEEERRREERRGEEGEHVLQNGSTDDGRIGVEGRRELARVRASVFCNSSRAPIARSLSSLSPPLVSVWPADRPTDGSGSNEDDDVLDWGIGGEERRGEETAD